MAHDVLRYYDTRFQRDANGKLVISPTQAVETYWYDVVNDTPSVAGLHDVLDRLLAIPADTDAGRRARVLAEDEGRRAAAAAAHRERQDLGDAGRKVQSAAQQLREPRTLRHLAVPPVRRGAAGSRRGRRDVPASHRKSVDRLAVRRPVRRASSA